MIIDIFFLQPFPRNHRTVTSIMVLKTKYMAWERGKLQLFRKINNERNFCKLKEQESDWKNKGVLWVFFFFSIEKTKLYISLFMSISYHVCIFFDLFIHLVICIMIFSLTKIYLKLYNVWIYYRDDLSWFLNCWTYSI
jgi:hypothetical protein